MGAQQGNLSGPTASGTIAAAGGPGDGGHGFCLHLARAVGELKNSPSSLSSGFLSCVPKGSFSSGAPSVEEKERHDT